MVCRWGVAVGLGRGHVEVAWLCVGCGQRKAAWLCGRGEWHCDLLM